MQSTSETGRRSNKCYAVILNIELEYAHVQYRQNKMNIIVQLVVTFTKYSSTSVNSFRWVTITASLRDDPLGFHSIEKKYANHTDILLLYHLPFQFFSIL